MSTVEIPLINGSQTSNFTIQSQTYTLRIIWRATTFGLVTDISSTLNTMQSPYGTLTGNYYLDILQGGVAIITGIPMITGTDLLSPFKYLNIPGTWILANDDQSFNIPTYSSLGQTCHLLVTY